jgi:hypothetical protein
MVSLIAYIVVADVFISVVSEVRQDVLAVHDGNFFAIVSVKLKVFLKNR